MDNILNAIKNNKKVRATLIEQDENVVDVMYKFLENPDCVSCINDFKSYIKQNLDSINTIIKEASPNSYPIVPTPPVIAPANLPPTPTNISGEVYEIEADPQQYKQLITHAQQQRWIFRGINILEKSGENNKKSWMVFFY